jgi:hypothetical protein
MVNATTGTIGPDCPRRFRTILADPPWDVQQKGARGAARHYPLMTLDRIKAMPVAELATSGFGRRTPHCATATTWQRRGGSPSARRSRG